RRRSERVPTSPSCALLPQSACIMRRRNSRRDSFMVGSRPAPGAGAVAPLRDALLVDLGDDFAISRQQRFGGTHFSAERQLSLEHAVGAVLFVFLDAAGNFRAAAAGAVGAFVHLATRAEIAD